MAKAVFHKNQRVYVKPVGTWANIEKVLPQWTKGLDEPLRVFYDVGLGREFTADELRAEQPAELAMDAGGEKWRILRAKNKWQPAEDCAHHPVPGTYPIIVTADTDWGGWRVPGAEYDLAPHKIEAQARLIVAAPKLAHLAKQLMQYASDEAHNVPNAVAGLATEFKGVLEYVEKNDA